MERESPVFQSGVKASAHLVLTAAIVVSLLLTACGGGGGSSGGGGNPTPNPTPGDVALPSAHIVFPTKISYTDASTVTVRGNAQDTSGVSSVTVNGVAATTTDGFASWRATVPIASGENVIAVSVTDAAGNTNSNADSVQVTNNGTPLIGLRAMDVDSAHDRVLLVDNSLRAIVAANRTTGRTSILSDVTHGNGTNFQVIEDLTVDTANNRVLVLDWGQNALFAVDLANGNRTLLSSAGNSTAATDLTLGTGVALDSVGNAAFVVTRGNLSVIRIDLSTGARTVVSSSTVGTGTTFLNPCDIVYDNVTNPGTPRLLVSDAARKAIFAVDINTGNRTTLSSSSPSGTGTTLEAPIRMKLDAANSRLLVVDGDINRNALVAVALATGNRTTLADATTGTGVALRFPLSVALDAANNRAFVAASAGGEIAAINLNTLNRTLFSNSNIGTGTKWTSVGGIARRNGAGNPSLLVLARSQRSVFNLDLITGVRTELSGPLVGSGAGFSDPTKIILDATSNPARALVLDTGLKALLAVDLANGDRTIVSSGFSFPRDLTLDAANNRVLVTDVATNLTAQALLAVDLITSSRTVLSDAGTGTGANFILPTGVVLDSVSNPGTPRALVSDGQQAGLIAVNLVNGDRSMFSSSSPSFGFGIPFLLPSDSVLDTVNRNVLVTDLSHGNVISVSLASRNRFLISGRNAADESVLGSGPILSFPSALDADFTNGVAFVVSGNHAAVMAMDIVSGDRVMIAR